MVNVQESFVETETYREIKTAIDIWMQVDGGGIIKAYGNPGFGKSHALKKLARDYNYGEVEVDRAIYVEITHASKSPNGLLKAILFAAGHRLDTSYERMFDYLRDVLMPRDIYGAKRSLLILDEAQNLELKMQREMCALQEQTRCVVVLAGNSERLASDSHTGKMRSLLDQIERRICWRCKIDTPTKDDLLAIGESYGVSCPNILHACVQIGQKTNIGIVSRLLQTAQMLSGESQPITMNAFRLAAHGIFGKTARDKQLLKLVKPKPGGKNERQLKAV